jgi:hypothetical protein
MAQNEPAPANAADANATMAMPADNTMMAGNDMAAAPAPVTTEAPEPAPAPAPARKSGGGFPWGAIGLVGLIGLLGRKRRD